MKFNIYNEWQNPLRNIHLAAFTSADNKNFTITGFNNAESSVVLDIYIENQEIFPRKKIYLYQTNEIDNCSKTAAGKMTNNNLKVAIKKIRFLLLQRFNK